MPQYQLKPGMERFRMVDGPFENREYAPGIIYTEIPPGEAHRFEEIRPVPAPKTIKKEVANAEHQS